MKTRLSLVLWVGCVLCAHAQDPYKARVDYIFGSLNQADKMPLSDTSCAFHR